jgi:hypothetical protein
MTLKGGTSKWDRKLESGVELCRCFTLFDTGADSANYIYSYYFDELRKIMKIPIIQIEEPVTFGDQKTAQTLLEAVILDVSFKDPTCPSKIIRNKHVFKVINLESKPIQYSAPIILGLPSICAHYLDLLVKALRYYYNNMKTSPWQSDSLEEELKRLRLRKQSNDKINMIHTELGTIVESNTYNELESDIQDELQQFCVACIQQQERQVYNIEELADLTVANILHDNNFESNEEDSTGRDASRMNTIEPKFDVQKYLEQTVPPWSYSIEESPEELDSPIPCSNSGLFNYLSTTHEEALQKYLLDCEKNTNPEVWPLVEDILKSDLAKNQFCPKDWTGMINIDPIDLKFIPEWEIVKAKGIGPKGSKAFVNEKMKDSYHKEFQRMKNYMYEKSNSSTASRILVADKATPPFVRICGDYRTVNKYVMLPQVTIPNIRNEIYRARKYKYFINLDLANGFHNLPITKATAEALALATEWGLYQPKFMPEGVRSAPQEFQRIMRQVFEPMRDSAIVIWDNILVLCNTKEEVREKLLEVLNICKKHNIILKMSKTQIGPTSAEFFGYIIRQNTIELSQERKDGIKALKFFKNKKGAQSFLGSCIFFKDFVPNYSKHTAILNDMVKNDFNWDPSTWKEDYEQHFENLKMEIQNAMTLHFPDYNKLWILRTDCSKDALGAVLFQVGDDGIYEPIAFVSQKLSDQAKNWAAVKLEAYAIYYAVKKLAYYLLGHTFVIEMDHANLVTMENTDQYIIQRWRSYLENFSFQIRHISGKQNLLADFQSRMFTISDQLDSNEDDL